MTRLFLMFALSTAALVACSDDGTDPTDITDTDDDTDTDTTGGDIQAGATVFGSNCAGCHGVDGTGTGNGPNLNDRVPGMAEAEVEATALNGSGNMPAIEITAEQAVDVAAYVVDTHGD